MACQTEGLADILVAPIRRQNMFKPGMGAWWWCRPKQHTRVYRGSRYNGGHILTSKPFVTETPQDPFLPDDALSVPKSPAKSAIEHKLFISNNEGKSIVKCNGCKQRPVSRGHDVIQQQRNGRMIPDVPPVWWLVKSNNLRFLASYHIEVSMLFPDGLVPREMTPVHVTTMLTSLRGGGY